ADLLIRDGLAWAEQNMALCDSPDGPSAYLPVAQDDLRFFEELSAIDSYAERVDYVRDYLSTKPPRLSTKKPALGEDPSLRD
ncbi:MAG TPA: hypothetical protein DCX23_03140, partial [Lachnospiraceae bacterium]|nr:hypothetical protein [Lachnospiraceae bacterium]